MEKKQVKKAPAPKKKVAAKNAPKKKVIKNELPIIAPEATPFVAYHEDHKVEPKVSFLSKIKKFLGF